MISVGERRARFFAILAAEKIRDARLETGIGFRNFQRAWMDSDDQSYGDSTQLPRKEAVSDVLRKEMQVKGNRLCPIGH